MTALPLAEKLQEKGHPCPICKLPSGITKTKKKAEMEQDRQTLGVDLLRQADFPAQLRRSGGGGRTWEIAGCRMKL